MDNIAYITPEQFQATTKAKTVGMVTSKPVVAGTRTSDQIPQTGLGNTIYLDVQCQLTVAGTVTGGTWSQGVNPCNEGIIKNFKIQSNQSFNMYDLTGSSLYHYVRQSNRFDPFSPLTGYNTSTANYSGSNRPVPGANITTGTYNINFRYPIRLSFNHMGEAALPILQTNQVFYGVNIEWANIVGNIGATGGTSDIITALTGSGLSVTVNSFNYSLAYSYFEFPNNKTVLDGLGPFISDLKVVSDSIQPGGLSQGQNVTLLPPNDLYTMAMLRFVNNGVMVPNSSFGQVQWKYSGNQYDFQAPFSVLQLQNFELSNGLPPSDGLVVFDFTGRRGLGPRRDTLDAFVASEVTGLQITTEFTGTPTGTQELRSITEVLRRVQASV